MPSKANINTGPAGAPFWGTETIRADKGLSKALHHKISTEVGARCIFVMCVGGGKKQSGRKKHSDTIISVSMSLPSVSHV